MKKGYSALLTWLTSWPDNRDAFGLAEHLLKLCLTEGRRFAQDIRSPNGIKARKLAFERAVRILSLQSSRGEFDQNLRNTIRLAFQDFYRDGLPLVAAAYGFAAGVDRELGQQFPFLWRHRNAPGGIRKIRAGDAVPIMRPPLARALESRINSFPPNFGERPDRLAHILIAPDLCDRFEITIDASFAGELGSLYMRPFDKVGVGLLNRPGELTWQTYTEDGVSFFWDVGPKRDIEPDQSRRLAALLSLARAEGVNLLVLPELCLTCVQQEALITDYLRDPGDIRLLVAGSVHATANGANNNVCRSIFCPPTGLLPVFAPQPLEHSKFAPFTYQDAGVDFVEGISQSPKRARIFLGSDWSFTMLICRDFLDGDLQKLLADFSPSLVVVPAFTPKSNAFSSMATGLSQLGQTSTFFINNPITPSRASRRPQPQAFFALPVDGAPCIAKRLGSQQLPCLCILEARELEAKWVSGTHLLEK